MKKRNLTQQRKLWNELAIILETPSRSISQIIKVSKKISGRSHNKLSFWKIIQSCEKNQVWEGIAQQWRVRNSNTSEQEFEFFYSTELSYLKIYFSRKVCFHFIIEVTFTTVSSNKYLINRVLQRISCSESIILE